MRVARAKSRVDVHGKKNGYVECVSVLIGLLSRGSVLYELLKQASDVS